MALPLPLATVTINPGHTLYLYCSLLCSVETIGTSLGSMRQAGNNRVAPELPPPPSTSNFVRAEPSEFPLLIPPFSHLCQLASQLCDCEISFSENSIWFWSETAVAWWQLAIPANGGDINPQLPSNLAKDVGEREVQQQALFVPRQVSYWVPMAVLRNHLGDLFSDSCLTSMCVLIEG